MSTYEQRDNAGSLFKNDRRERDTQPNATGKAMIGGVLYYVDAWTKRDKNGNPWQSLAFKPVGETRPGAQTQGRRASLKDQLDDEVPF